MSAIVNWSATRYGWAARYARELGARALHHAPSLELFGARGDGIGKHPSKARARDHTVDVGLLEARPLQNAGAQQAIRREQSGALRKKEHDGGAFAEACAVIELEGAEYDPPGFSSGTTAIEFHP